MEVLVPSESYGWARRKIREANMTLSRYQSDQRDGNALLVASLAGAREALMYLQSGSPRGPYDAYLVVAGGQIFSEYKALLSYIDMAIDMSGRARGNSASLYNLTHAIVSTVNELVDAAGSIWKLEAPSKSG